MNGISLVAAVALWVMVVSACSSDPAPPPVEATDGEELFMMRSLGGQAGCVTCHSLAPDRVLVGPSLSGLADRAAQRTGGDPAPYIRMSIVDPDAVVVDGFEAGKMPSVFAEILTDQQIDALVDYLLEVE